MRNNRAQEIVNSFTSFRKDAYYKGEELPEVLKLQDEIVKITFSEEHADLANLRIWDVERHLEAMNKECGGIADEELMAFEDECKDFCNLIKGMISGNKGEARMSRSLEKVRINKRVLKNVELSTDGYRTEIDAVTITEGGVFIVEVKNTAKNVFIDESGEYYRTGEYLRWDSSIGSKMKLRQDYIQDILERAGYSQIPVKGIVVFTDNRIEVRNCCEELTTCFVNQLPYLIEQSLEPGLLTDKDLDYISNCIEKERCKEAYPIRFDAEQFKQDFAKVLVTLEMASADNNELNTAEEQPEPRVKVRAKDRFRAAISSVLSSPYMRRAGSAAASLMIAAAVTTIRNI